MARSDWLAHTFIILVIIIIGDGKQAHYCNAITEGFGYSAPARHTHATTPTTTSFGKTSSASAAKVIRFGLLMAR